MTDAARPAPRPYTFNQRFPDLVSLPANHVLVSDLGITFSKANVPVPEPVVNAAKRLYAALTAAAVPTLRDATLAQAHRCGDQLGALGGLVAALNEAKAKLPQGDTALDGLSVAMNEFCKVFAASNEQPAEPGASTDDGPWHRAVLEACMVRESCYVPDDPAKTISQLLQWEFAFALAPAVSARTDELADTKGHEPFYFRAIDCPHSIDRSRVVLRYDPTQPGANALAPISERLSVTPGALPDVNFWIEAQRELDGLSPAEVLHGTAFPRRVSLSEVQRQTLAKPADERVALTSAVAKRRQRLRMRDAVLAAASSIDGHAETGTVETENPPKADQHEEQHAALTTPVVQLPVPRPATVWQHAGGAEYVVIGTTSEPDEHKAHEHPQLVIYVGVDGGVWARPLSRFLERFTEQPNAVANLPPLPVHMTATPFVWLAALQQALTGERGLREIWEARAKEWSRIAHQNGAGDDAPAAAHDEIGGARAAEPEPGMEQIGEAISAPAMAGPGGSICPRAAGPLETYAENGVARPQTCHCHRCLNDVMAEGTHLPVAATRMIVCPTCHNKRCPHARDHDVACTGSNAPGEPGSVHQ